VSCHTFATEQRIAAAWLHDVVEDTGRTIEDLYKADFPKSTVDLVYELTAIYTKKNNPTLNREARKRLEFGRISTTSIWAKIIKCYDRIDNLRDMGLADAGFRRIYCEESLLLADALTQNVHRTVNGLHIEVMELADEIRTAAIEMMGHAPTLFGFGERSHYPLDGPPGAKGL